MINRLVLNLYGAGNDGDDSMELSSIGSITFASNGVLGNIGAPLRVDGGREVEGEGLNNPDKPMPNMDGTIDCQDEPSSHGDLAQVAA